MLLTDFFANDYVDQASYDNLRKISSLVDGQKNASRKILYTVLEKNINKKIKVSQLGAKIAEFAQYLHGSLDGVVVNLGQDYSGTNNIPLLQKKGNFGTRFSPEASAARYIYTYGTSEFFDLFKREDTPVLKHQSFEGDAIEPMFYVPSLPILLVNGSEGVSSGFAQKILPRDPKVLKKYIKAVLTGKKTPKLTPYYNGFNGSIVPGINPGQWYIKGNIKRLSINRVQISEIPVGYDLKGYLKVLDKLEDDKIIQSYRDKSENDVFHFEVTILSKTLKSWSDDELLSKLKLVKTVTENYTVIDEFNKIRVHENADDIMMHYIRVKKEYIGLRKAHQLSSIQEEIKYNYSKYLFIKMIVNEELIINKRKKAEIVKDLDKVEQILTKDGNYNYLLRLSILTLSEEEMSKIEQDIKNKKAELDKLNNTTDDELWLSEI